MEEEYWLPVADVTALRNAVIHAVENGELEQPVDSGLSPMDPLLQNAEQTKWNRLPLCAIAEAHKKEAERLIKRGSPDASVNADYNNAIFVEYFKYLQLYPYKDSPDYMQDNPAAFMSGSRSSGSWKSMSIILGLGIPAISWRITRLPQRTASPRLVIARQIVEFVQSAGTRSSASMYGSRDCYFQLHKAKNLNHSHILSPPPLRTNLVPGQTNISRPILDRFWRFLASNNL
ncbi:hypothetical protein B0H19DRAFT_1289818 [Mycena capillaripes]|nr:hypothetical protein B0H19DRAFT_1289818 [Mycena capillaripes]